MQVCGCLWCFCLFWTLEPNLGWEEGQDSSRIFGSWARLWGFVLRWGVQQFQAMLSLAFLEPKLVHLSRSRCGAQQVQTTIKSPRRPPRFWFAPAHYWSFLHVAIIAIICYHCYHVVPRVRVLRWSKSWGPFEFVRLVRLVRFVCFVCCIKMQIDGPWVDSCDVSIDFTRTISHRNVWGFLTRCSSKAKVPWFVLCPGFVEGPKSLRCTTRLFFCTVKCYLNAARWCSRSSRWRGSEHGASLALCTCYLHASCKEHTLKLREGPGRSSLSKEHQLSQDTWAQCFAFNEISESFCVINHH